MSERLTIKRAAGALAVVGAALAVGADAAMAQTALIDFNSLLRLRESPLAIGPS